MKKNFTEIEEIIETRIAQLSEEYDLDRYDIEDIRLEAYQENGWSCDPFPLEDGDEEEDGWMEEGCHYRSMEEQLAEVGMSMRTSFKEALPHKGKPQRGCSS